MNTLIKTAIVASIMVSGSVLAKPYHHALEPHTGVEVQMYADIPSRSFDFRTMLGVILPASGIEVHMGDLVSTEQATSAYDPEGVSATWHQITPAIGVEKHLLLR
ncbi:MAG: hypothetical protein OIF57_15180 [Marinobacterium sp.]|nr:hypothetical protein [Marinobacterium sp.]